jgi:hypothetical protein
LLGVNGIPFTLGQHSEAGSARIPKGDAPKLSDSILGTMDVARDALQIPSVPGSALSLRQDVRTFPVSHATRSGQHPILKTGGGKEHAEKHGAGKHSRMEESIVNPLGSDEAELALHSAEDGT